MNNTIVNHSCFDDVQSFFILHRWIPSPINLVNNTSQHLFIHLNISETCNCAENIYFNWYEKPPYVTYNETTGQMSGLFPPIMEEIYTEVCGTCKGRTKGPTFQYFISKTGDKPTKQNEPELKRSAHFSLNFLQVHYLLFILFEASSNERYSSTRARTF